MSIERRPLVRTVHGALVALSRDGDYTTAQRYRYTGVWFGDPQTASAEIMPLVPVLPLQGMSERFVGSVVNDCS